ncbi:MAG: hypothetical protein ACOXZS_05195 [Bacilli bacterium]|jgi:hypothetical protein
MITIIKNYKIGYWTILILLLPVLMLLSEVAIKVIFTIGQNIGTIIRTIYEGASLKDTIMCIF